MNRRAAGRVALALLVLSFAGEGKAQSYPAHPVHLVVTLPPGGPTDTTARLIGQKLGELLGQTIVVENKPGAGGRLAAESVARSAPDGYTVLFGGVGTHGVAASLYKRLPYDPVKDFTCASLASYTANVLLVHPSLPVKTVAELVAYAKAHPGLDYGSSGIGNTPHLTMEMFRTLAGMDLTHVPYKGGSQYSLAIVTGEVKLAFNNLPGELGNIRAGKLRALAVSSPKRQAQAPDVPTLSETYPGFEVTVWFGFFLPAATPRPIVAKLNEAAVAALNSPDLRERLALQAVEPMPSTPEQCSAYVTSEIAKWGKAIRDAGVPQE